MFQANGVPFDHVIAAFACFCSQAVKCDVICRSSRENSCDGAFFVHESKDSDRYRQADRYVQFLWTKLTTLRADWCQIVPSHRRPTSP